MGAVATSLLLALGQLADPKVLRVLVKSLAVTLVLFAMVAVGGWFAIDRLLAWAGLGDVLFAGAQPLRGLASLVLALLGLWLAWRIVALAVIEFFADEVVQAVEARHYPGAAQTARDLPVHEQFSTSIAVAVRALAINLVALPFALLLLVTGVGAALLFWLINAVLIGRELQDMVWLRHRRERRDPAPVGKAQRFILGAAVAALLALPIVNFIAPILGAAAATHLIHRKETRR
ncbi:MAG: EI24 domain-containing protein [Altererythrobacter sp.]|nr:EI24 domain-containing protein [Altererythrobacter sp.]